MGSIFFSTAVVSAFLVGFCGTPIVAAVWTEEKDGPRGDPVAFCMYGSCEDTRFILRGSSAGHSFFGLANGYQEGSTYQESERIFTSSHWLNGKLLSAEEYATVRLMRGYDEETVVEVSEDGRFLSVEGWISEEMAADFVELTSSSPLLIGISLKSPGGDSEFTLRMAKIIADRNLSAFIAEESYCREACSTLFLAGHDRLAKGSLEIAPLISAFGDQEGMRRQQEALLKRTQNDETVLPILRSLAWNQTYWMGRGSEFDRDLPGDALSN